MNREILFRGKRLSDRTWAEGDLSHCVVVGEIHIQRIEDNLSTTIHRIEPSTVCQYTGMTDKNGRKIFEGDIVNVDFKEGRIGAVEKTYPYTVKFNQSDTRFELMGNDELLGKPCLCAGNQFIMEVIGNIFDNSELLED